MECARLISAQNTVIALSFLGGFQGTDSLILCTNNTEQSIKNPAALAFYLKELDTFI